MKCLVDPLKFYFYVTRRFRFKKCIKEADKKIRSRNYHACDADGLPEAYINYKEKFLLQKLDPETYGDAYKKSLEEIKRIHDKMDHGLR